jgi:hypothetical protein
MSKGQFEVSLPVPFLKGDIQAEVYEVGGASPVSIIRSDQDWGVKVRWQLEGSLLPFICGKWCIHLRLESLGTGRELTLEAPKLIRLDPCGKGDYYLDFRVKRGIIKPEHCSTPYKPIVTVTYYTECYAPGPFAGYVELPILQFYDANGVYRGNGNGHHAVEAQEEVQEEVQEAVLVEAQA